MEEGWGEYTVQTDCFQLKVAKYHGKRGHVHQPEEQDSREVAFYWKAGWQRPRKWRFYEWVLVKLWFEGPSNYR